MRPLLPVLLLLLHLLVLLAPACANQLALLAGTLKTFQRHACDATTLTLTCPRNTTIDITFARYGRPRQAVGRADAASSSIPAVRDPCPPLPQHSPYHPGTSVCEYPEEVNYKTLQLVVKSCQHKQQCRIEVMPHTFSDTDPCPHIRKYIEVAYKCRPETFINKIVCENGEIDLRCTKDSRLAIYSVLFGRSPHGSIACPQPPGVPEEDCQASYANEIVMKLCHGFSQCHLQADPHKFGSPCSPQSRMYMKIVYTCVPKKILKIASQDNESEESGEGALEGAAPPSLPAADPAALDPHWPPQSSAPDYHLPPHTSTTFYNPTVTTQLSDKKGEDEVPAGPQYPQDGAANTQPELINCTITILSGSKKREIGFLTEWMRAVAFIKRNFEKFVLYLMFGLCVGLLLFLVVVVGQLLWERHTAKKEAKMLHDPLTSVFAAEIDDVDGDLDVTGVAGSSGNRSPSPQEPSQDVVRYNTTRPGVRRHDSDTNPRSLSRNNNNQYFYS